MMNSEKNKIEIEINSKRPDFRVFLSYLWDDTHNVDSDGDSYNPASRDWTALYMSSREIENQTFKIGKIKNKPLVFEVTSENNNLLNRVAYFLKRETKGVTKETDDTLIQNMGDNFDLKGALERADYSIWRRSTLENPYPNLK